MNLVTHKSGLILYQLCLFILGVSLGMLILGTIFNLFSYRSFPSVIFPIPSAHQIGSNYLQAVLDINDSHISKDREGVYGQLKRDISKYGGAKTRNISIVGDLQSGNSDHVFEITSINFEYRHSIVNPWQKAKIQLITITNVERSNSLHDALPFRTIHCSDI